MKTESKQEIINSIKKYLYDDTIEKLDTDAQIISQPYFISVIKKAFLNNQKQKPYAVIAGDFDKLNMLNEKYGFEEGNKSIHTSLEKIVRILESNMEKEKEQKLIPCRMGGDEFIFILTNTKHEPKTENEIKEKINKINEELSKKDGNTHKLHMTLDYEFSDQAESLEENYEHIDQKVSQTKLKAEAEDINYYKSYRAFFDALRLSREFEFTTQDMKKIIASSIEATYEIIKEQTQNDKLETKKELSRNNKPVTEKELSENHTEEDRRESEKIHQTEDKEISENDKVKDEGNAATNEATNSTTNDAINEATNSITNDEINDATEGTINDEMNDATDGAINDEMNDATEGTISDETNNEKYYEIIDEPGIELKELTIEEANKINEILLENTEPEEQDLEQIPKEHLEHIRRNLLYSYVRKAFNKQYLEKSLIGNLSENQKYNITILSLSGLKLSNLIKGHNTTDQYLEQNIFPNVEENIDKKTGIKNEIFNFEQENGYKISIGGGDFAYILPENKPLQIDEKFEQNNDSEQILKYAIIKSKNSIEKDEILDYIENAITYAKERKDEFKRELFQNEPMLRQLLKQCINDTVTQYYNQNKEEALESNNVKNLIEKQIQAMLEIKTEQKIEKAENSENGEHIKSDTERGTTDKVKSNEEKNKNDNVKKSKNGATENER